MAERDVEQLLGAAADDTRRWSASSDVPVTAIERAASRRRGARLAAAGTAALLIVGAAVAVAGLGTRAGDGDGTRVDVAAEPDHPVRTADPDAVRARETAGDVRVDGLPTEGVAVQEGDAVLLLSTRGELLQRLDGFRIEDGLQPGELLLVGPNGTPYELDALAGVLAPREARSRGLSALSYGARLVPPTEHEPGRVELGGAGRGEASFHLPAGSSVTVSWDRDIVTRTSDRQQDAEAFDLRTSRERPLPDGCRVADRHGPAWFLLCAAAGHDATSIVRLDPDDRTVVLAAPSYGSGWSDVLVSPDGSEFLAYGCDAMPVYIGSTAGDRLQSLVDLDMQSMENLDASELDPIPLGWSASGDAILWGAKDDCDGSAVERAGVYAFDGDDARPIHEQDVVPGERAQRAAMWMPLLERR